MTEATKANAKLRVLQHSLGLDQFGRGRAYRNHFVTSPGTTDWPHCESLVNEGLMSRAPPSALTGGGHCFAVTAQGRAYVAEHSPKPPALTASQRRYRDFLRRVDSGLSFGDWLKARTGGSAVKPERPGPQDSDEESEANFDSREAMR